MKRFLCVVLPCMLLLSLSASTALQQKMPEISLPTVTPSAKPTDIPSQVPSSKPTNPEVSEENAVSKMNVQIGNTIFTATLSENSAASSFAEMLKNAPVVIQMSDYSGFEKVGSLGTSLPTSDSKFTARAGDIVLYNGNQIVIFYGSNSWSYTRIGKIDDLSGWEEALGSGDVQVTFNFE